ncbi:PIN domain-containing protein, partial [Vibrio tubiashii]|uniref:PIN domain-containing protein n=1 Tax=Vibrio tubiashii TaxID=29498 RepID=UPI00349ECA8E
MNTAAMTDKLKLVIDTSVIKRIDLRNVNIKKLERLHVEGFIELCVPEVVLKEWITGRQKDGLASLTNLKKATNDINRIVASNWLSGTGTTETKLKDKILNVCMNWVNKNKLRILPIKEVSTEQIFSDYFIGSGAFETVKNRDDFPDNVIYHNVSNLSKDNIVAFIVADNNLYQKSLSLENCHTYKSIDSFLESELIRGHLESINNKDKKTSHIINELERTSSQEKFLDLIKSLFVSESKKTFSSEQIQLDLDMEAVSHVINTITIEQPVDIEELIVYNPNYLSDDQFYMTLSIDGVKAKALIECDDVHYRKLHRAFTFDINLIEYNGNTSVYESTLLIDIMGKVLIKNVAQDLEINEIAAHLQYLESSDNPFDIEL